MVGWQKTLATTLIHQNKRFGQVSCWNGKISPASRIFLWDCGLLRVTKRKREAVDDSESLAISNIIKNGKGFDGCQCQKQVVAWLGNWFKDVTCHLSAISWWLKWVISMPKSYLFRSMILTQWPWVTAFFCSLVLFKRDLFEWYSWLRKNSNPGCSKWKEKL